MGDWVSCPDNNPWTLPDGARIRTTVEGIRHTVRVPQNPWLPSGYTGAHIDLQDLGGCVWEYWSEEATEGPSEFVAGFEAAAAETRWQIRRVRLLGWLRLLCAVTAALAVSAAAAVACGTVAYLAGVVVALAAAAAAIVVSGRITRMDREARRG